MTSVGETLQLERLRQGVDLADIAQQLCITQRYLRAIEENDIKSLPGGFFYKSFVRQYAAILGIDDQVFTPQLESVLSEQEPPPLPGQDPHYPVHQADPILGETNLRFFSDYRIGWSAVALIAVLIGCSGFYAWWNKHRAEPVLSRSTSAQGVEQPVALGGRAPRVTVSALEAQDGPGNLQHIVLSLSATEKTWISISSDGKVIFSGVLEPGQTKTLSGREVAKMRVGNAGGIDVLWNGKPVEPLGERGQVRVVLFTPDNYQILPATSM